MSTSTGNTALAPTLPQGGGAIAGLGETFGADPQSGTGNLSFPLPLPPGRAGLTPSLTLRYSSGAPQGPFGLGWSLDVPEVSRRTERGLPRYRDADPFAADADTMVLSGAEELVPRRVGDRVSYQPRVEGLHARIERIGLGRDSTWQVRTLDGRRSVYGGVVDGVAAVVADPDQPDRIFSWALSRTEDVYGNRVEYAYERHGGAQLYLTEIRYVDLGAGEDRRYRVRVRLVYEDRPDPFTVARAGFPVRTTRRVSRVEIRTGERAEHLWRGVALGYAQAEGNRRSLLTRIRVYGEDGAQTERSPPLELRYGGFSPTARALVPVQGAPTTSLSDPRVAMVDLNGDGLPDLIELAEGRARAWRNLGEGRFEGPRPLPLAPAGVALGSPGVQLLDADGDGRIELLVTRGDSSGSYGLGPSGGFEASRYRRHPTAPSFPEGDPELRLVDLDGDGVADALRLGDAPRVYLADREGRWAPGQRSRSAPPGLSFTDPRVHLADLSGDGLSDLVFVQAGRLTVYPGLGRGEFGPASTLSIPGRLPDGFDPRRVLLGDVDGDGADDLIYVEDGRVRIWLNQGEALGETIEVLGTPRVHDQSALRLVDLLGSGVPGLLWTRDAASDGRPSWYFLDLTDGVRPYLLTGMDNHRGATTSITYASSARQPGPRALEPGAGLPFPVLVVASVRTAERFSGSAVTTRYRYEHGVWDGLDREFRGFGKVTRWDADDAGSPPIETRTWFHTGPVPDGAGSWTTRDHTSEYWREPWGPSLLRAPPAYAAWAGGLRGRARHDLLRAQRGGTLRVEVYALDGGARQGRPVSVTESLTLSLPVEEGRALDPERAAGSAATFLVFQPFAAAGRETLWERGDEPRTRLEWSAHPDAWGLPTTHLSLALPRGQDPLAPLAAHATDAPTLATLTRTERAGRDEAGLLLGALSFRETRYALEPLQRLGVAELLELALHGAPDSRLNLRIDGQTLALYDGPAFIGEAPGVIGRWGAVVRTLTLVSPADQVEPLAGEHGYLLDVEGGEPGLWICSEARALDVQQGAGLGLLVASRDAMGRTSTVACDPWLHLPVRVTDPVGLDTVVVMDPRTLQPASIRDPNGIVLRATYSPLGALSAVWVLDPEGGGDREELPSIRHEQDLEAWDRAGQPLSSRTRRSVWHTADPRASDAEIIEEVVYSDGLGRALQTRSRADAQRLGVDPWGGSGLPADRAAGVGAPRLVEEGSEPWVRVGGWTQYDDKGRVIAAYEPFFSRGFAWRDAAQEADLAGQSAVGLAVRTTYDALGRAVRVTRPDGAQVRTVHGRPTGAGPDDFTPNPWEQWTWSPLDNGGRTHPVDSRSASLCWDTPSSVEVDALGRPWRAVARTRELADGPIIEVSTTTVLDARGRATAVIDPLGRVAARARYDLLDRAWWSWTLDAGERRQVLDAAGAPLLSVDARGAEVWTRYDAAGRAAEVWARDGADQPRTLQCRYAYGDGGDPAQDPARRAEAARRRTLGRLATSWDPAGRVEILAYDLGGQPAEVARLPVCDAVLAGILEGGSHPGWEGGEPALLGDDSAADRRTERFLITTSRDALGRAWRVELPADAQGRRPELLARYGRSGALQAVALDGLEIIRHMASDARGQRVLTVYGNGWMSRVATDRATGRPLRHRVERWRAGAGDQPWVPSDPGSPLLDSAFTHDLDGELRLQVESAPGAGVLGWMGGADALVREFDYDPLGRLVRATGREAKGRETAWAWPGDRYGAGGVPQRASAPSETRPYTELYTYDLAGNLRALVHRAATVGASGVSWAGWTRTFELADQRNQLVRLSDGQGGADTHAYDAAGHLVRELGTRSFVWDAFGSLVRFREDGGARSATVYDAAGKRVKRLVRRGASVEVSTWIDGVYEALRWSGDEAGENRVVHVTDGVKRVALVRSGPPAPGDEGPAVQIQVNDARQSCIFTLDEAGVEIRGEEFTPYGETSVGCFARKRYRFQGKARDAETGLGYHGARYYAPWMCRWVSPDPAGLVDGPNLYVFCRGNPVGWVDLSGKEASPGENSGAIVEADANGVRVKAPLEKGGEGTIEVSPEGVVTVTAKGKDTADNDWSFKATVTSMKNRLSESIEEGYNKVKSAFAEIGSRLLGEKSGGTEVAEAGDEEDSWEVPGPGGTTVKMSKTGEGSGSIEVSKKMGGEAAIEVEGKEICKAKAELEAKAKADLKMVEHPRDGSHRLKVTGTVETTETLSLETGDAEDGTKVELSLTQRVKEGAIDMFESLIPRERERLDRMSTAREAPADGYSR